MIEKKFNSANRSSIIQDEHVGTIYLICSKTI